MAAEAITPFIGSLRLLIQSAIQSGIDMPVLLGMSQRLPNKLKAVVLTTSLMFKSHDQQEELLRELITFLSTHPCDDCGQAINVRISLSRTF